MDILIEKSKDNFDAIQILEASKHYTPIIHCAYYSSLQLVMYYFYEYVENDREKIKNNISYTKTSSHSYFINGLTTEIKKINRPLSIKIYKALNNFKKKRNDADYSEIIISESDAYKARDIAKSINKCLKKLFENGKCEGFFI